MGNVAGTFTILLCILAASIASYGMGKDSATEVASGGRGGSDGQPGESGGVYVAKQVADGWKVGLYRRGVADNGTVMMLVKPPLGLAESFYNGPGQSCSPPPPGTIFRFED